MNIMSGIIKDSNLILRNKAKEEYNCLVCNTKIVVGLPYFYYRMRSNELAKAFNDITGMHHANFNSYIIYVGLHLCSKECVNDFYKWNIDKLDSDINIRYEFLIIKTIKDRIESWRSLIKKYKPYYTMTSPIENRKLQGKGWIEN
jgi:hypothetical protein